MPRPCHPGWILSTALLVTAPAGAQPSEGCKQLPSHAELQKALAAAQAESNGGLGFHMWGTIVDRDGMVCAVAFTGSDRGEQWPGSRVISAQKAGTTAAFSLPKFALSTANLFSAVQPGQPLYGLQHSNPVDTTVGYAGPVSQYGTPNDPMRGKRLGGVNVFGGGVGLYTAGSRLVGGLGVSGDTACADHIIAWKVRHRLNLDNVPAGVAADKSDNIVHDVTVDAGTGHTTSKGGFGHPACSEQSTKIASGLPSSHPIGPGQ